MFDLPDSVNSSADSTRSRSASKPRSDKPEEAAEDEATVEAKRDTLVKVKKDIGVLENFYNDIKNQWSDIARRNIGRVDWAPKISVDARVTATPKTLGRWSLMQ